MLLVVAASDQEYLLEVTDFSTISDLQHFIAQLIFDYPEDASPLSKELHRRIAQSPFGQASTPKSHNLTGLLNIRLSPDSLACLYAFSDFASSNMNTEELNRVDMLSKLAPCQFVDLSHLIRHACETDTIADELRELIDLSRLQSVHHQAIVKLPKLVERFSRLTVVGNWS
jgi:hypothetical protein